MAFVVVADGLILNVSFLISQDEDGITYQIASRLLGDWSTAEKERTVDDVTFLELPVIEGEEAVEIGDEDERDEEGNAACNAKD